MIKVLHTSFLQARIGNFQLLETELSNSNLPVGGLASLMSAGQETSQ